MDIRSINTQRRIQEGFLSLLDEKSFSLCTTSDIIITAQVSKRSFYSYYKNKFELVQQIEDDLINGLKKALETDRNNLNAIKTKYSEDTVDKLADLEFDTTIQYCDKHKQVFSRLLSANGDISFIIRLEKVGAEEITERLAYYFHSSSPMTSVVETDSMKIIRMLYSYIIVGLLTFWMSHSEMMSMDEVKGLLGLAQQKSPIELMAYYHKLYKQLRNTN